MARFLLFFSNFQSFRYEQIIVVIENIPGSCLPNLVLLLLVFGGQGSVNFGIESQSFCLVCRRPFGESNYLSIVRLLQDVIQPEGTVY